MNARNSHGVVEDYFQECFATTHEFTHKAFLFMANLMMLSVIQTIQHWMTG